MIDKGNQRDHHAEKTAGFPYSEKLTISARVLSIMDMPSKGKEKLDTIFNDRKVNSEVLQRTMNNFKF